MRALLLRYRPDVLATLRLSTPIVIGQLGIMLMGVADTVMVGRLGAATLGAASVAHGTFFLVAILGLGTLSIVAPLVAAARSRHDHASCARLLRTALTLAVGLAGGMWGIIYLLQRNFFVFGQPVEVAQLAQPYLLILSVSVLPLLVFTAVRQFSDGLEQTQVAMVITFFGLTNNVFFNWLLITGHWGFPAMGLNGTGVATVLSRFLMAGLMLAYVFRARVFRPFVYAPADPLPTHPPVRVSALLRKGLPGGLQYFFEYAAFATSTYLIGWLGKYPLAAHQIALNMASITYMMASGISAAGAIRVGEAVGQGDLTHVRRAGTTALALSVAFMAGCCLLFLAANGPLVALYTDDPRVAVIAASLLVIAGFFQLSDGIQVVGLGVLRGIGDVNVPTFIALFAYWIIGLPLGYALAFWWGQGAVGIWTAFLVGLSVSATLLTLRFYQLTTRRRVLSANG